MKTFLNCTMPALVNINVGSLRGTSDDDASFWWPASAEEVEEGGPDFVDAAHRLLTHPR